MTQSASCDHPVCPSHSGQDEKIRSAFAKMNLLIWMIGILIMVIIAVGGALYSGVSAVHVAVAGYSSRITAVEESLKKLEAADQRLNDRVDRLESRK
jgi:hypothetical protein